MAEFGEIFRIDDLPEGEGYDPIPAGWYQSEIVSAELKDTKAGTGKYIAIGYRVEGPDHAGRMVFANLNIRNSNPDAERIGREQLGALMRATGMEQVSNTDQLIGAPVQIKVSIKEDPQYGPRNEVKGWKPINAGGAPPAQPSAAPTPPWKR